MSKYSLIDLLRHLLLLSLTAASLALPLQTLAQPKQALACSSSELPYVTLLLLESGAVPGHGENAIDLLHTPYSLELARRSARFSMNPNLWSLSMKGD